MHDNIVLLILADLPDGFSLADFKLAGPESEVVAINHDKYPGLEIIEFIVNGMTFEATYHTEQETSAQFKIDQLTHLFCDQGSSSKSSIAVTLGENLKGGGHIAAINRALLKLASVLSNKLAAQAVAWLPARQLIGRDYFAEVADQYWEQGPFPVLAQVAVAQREDSYFATTGLNYFADQEIILEAPSTYPSNEVVKRVLRIASDIATRGKIKNAIETDGMIEGERIEFKPDASGQVVNIRIRAPADPQTSG